MHSNSIEACTSSVTNMVRRLLECYCIRPHQDYTFICIDSGKCVELLTVAKSTARLAKNLANKLRGRDVTMFTLGVHTARLCGSRLQPLLGILHLLPSKPCNHYIVVNEKGERLFTYGRDVFQENVLEAKIDSRCNYLPLLVVNRYGDILGFAKPRHLRGRVIFQNALDVGWYLRSGV